MTIRELPTGTGSVVLTVDEGVTTLVVTGTVTLSVEQCLELARWFSETAEGD